jgi:hypothetical protein
MTRQRSFKRLVRSRMAKTGESYTAARASLLAPQEPEEAEQPALATSDESIRRRTGRGWEEWFDLLDEWGAADRPHPEIARWVAEQQGVEPLAWGAQAVTVSYERARGGRAVGEHPDGFAITASKTVAVPVERLFAAFEDDAVRERWLSGAPLTLRTATAPRTARYDWEDGSTRVNVAFDGLAAAKSSVAVSHERLADAAAAEEMKAWWRERLRALEQVLEGGEVDA